MLDRSYARQFLFFLAAVACLSMSLQTEGSSSFVGASKSTLRCVEASWVTASPLPTDTAGQSPYCDEPSPAESLCLVSALPDTPLRQQRYIPPTARTPLEKGCRTDVYRPPIVTV